MRNILRDAQGRFAAYNWRQLERRMIISLMVVGGVVLGGGLVTNNYAFLEEWAVGNELRATNTFAVAEAAELFEGLSVEQLEAKLDAIVWHGESGGLSMGEGDIFPVFDPSQSMYQKCIRIGGKQHKDCLSYGPRQEKIGTIQHYYPTLYGKEVSDREARDIAEGNESSRRFFLDCAVKVKGCANNWTAFNNGKTTGQLYIDLIREAKGIKID